jgi:pyruvate/2-oxoglutarate dehydrogenase complex dihydrolipoamide dehydrogenase (E3) component
MAAMAAAQRRQGDRRRMKARFDAAIIGAGAAGLSTAYGLARLGLKIALIERGVMGGECLNHGCVPSKALLAAARGGADWGQAQARVRAAIAAIAPADSAERYAGLGCTVMRGQARLIGDREIDVEGRRIQARRVVVAVGSRTAVPAFCTALPYLTNETIWDLPMLPAHLLILGAGPMGCEMAEAFANLGAQVTLIGHVLPREAPALAAPIIESLAARGVTLVGARAVAARPGPALVLEDGTELTGSHLLLATGRVVDVTGLGLAAGPNGIRTDAGLRVHGHRHIYAAGDCADPDGIGPQRLTHVAGAHAALLVRRIAFRLPGRLSATPPVRVVYTAPELAQVGATTGATILTHPFTENDRAIAEQNTIGLARLVLDARGRLIGAGITAPGAGEMIGLYALAIAQKLPLRALAGLMLPYPTRSEAGKRAAGSHFAARLFGPKIRKITGLLNHLP